MSVDLSIAPEPAISIVAAAPVAQNGGEMDALLLGRIGHSVSVLLIFSLLVYLKANPDKQISPYTRKVNLISHNFAEFCLETFILRAKLRCDGVPMPMVIVMLLLADVKIGLLRIMSVMFVIF